MDEILEKRTLSSKTFLNGAGKFVLRKGLNAPLHYLDAEGNLADIDLADTSAKRDADFFIDKASFTLRANKSTPAYRFTDETAVAVELKSLDDVAVSPFKAKKFQNSFLWDNIALNTDYKIVPRKTGVATFLVLRKAATPRKFVWEVTGDKSLLHPIIGYDKNGGVLELAQRWQDDNLIVEWSGRVLRATNLRKLSRAVYVDPVYPVVIDPTVNLSVAASADDVFSYKRDTWTSGAWNQGLADNNFTVGHYSWGGNTYTSVAAIRFTGVTIPQGSTITSATVTVRVVRLNGSSTQKHHLFGHDVDNAAAWGTSNRAWAITKTTGKEDINVTATGTLTIPATSPVQDIINRSGFASGNAIGLGFFNHTVTPVAPDLWMRMEAFDHSGTAEPEIEIVYEEAAGGGALIWSKMQTYMPFLIR